MNTAQMNQKDFIFCMQPNLFYLLDANSHFQYGIKKDHSLIIHLRLYRKKCILLFNVALFFNLYFCISSLKDNIIYWI